jgi:competence ComEA-like helix-hairpin-helix protein
MTGALISVAQEDPMVFAIARSSVSPLPIARIVLVVSIVLAVGPVGPVGRAAAASEGARPPALHSTVPSHMAPPRADGPGKSARAESRPVRVVEPSRASRAHTAPGEERGARADAAPEKIDINTADVKTLMTLPGVTRTVAQRIVAYRETHGPFRRPADLRKVEGVGEGTWEKTRKHIVAK